MYKHNSISVTGFRMETYFIFSSYGLDFLIHFWIVIRHSCCHWWSLYFVNGESTLTYRRKTFRIQPASCCLLSCDKNNRSRYFDLPAPAFTIVMTRKFKATVRVNRNNSEGGQQKPMTLNLLTHNKICIKYDKTVVFLVNEQCKESHMEVIIYI